MNQKGLAPILIVLILAFLVGGYLVYQKQTKPIPSPQPTTQSTTSPTPQSSSSPTDETATWKTYTTDRYSFMYPGDWSISKSDYLNTVEVKNPKINMEMKISNSQYPFGIENPDTKMESKDLKLNIGGKDYMVKETVVSTKSTGIPRLIYVNFKTDAPNIIYLLISSTSLNNYQSSKDIVLKILSTFRFID